MELPTFKYHPDPIKTGSVKPSDEVCECCKQKRGFIYEGALYSASNVEHICPWCIADGQADRMFDIEFASISPPILDPKKPPKLDVAGDAITELLHRTPGFASFQETRWPVHCSDFCEFHGLATVGEFNSMSAAEKERLTREEMLDGSYIEECQVGNDAEELHYFFKFVCRHCAELMFQIDMD